MKCWIAVPLVLLAACGKKEPEPAAPSPPAVPIPLDVDRGPRALEGVAAQTYATADGARIYGSWLPAEGETKAVAVLVHMLGRVSEDWNALRPPLAKAGVASLAFDLRGHQRSYAPGSPKVESFDTEQWLAVVNDIAASVAQARAVLAEEEAPTSVPLFLIGGSIGANLSLIYAAEHPEEVKGLVLLSPGLDYRGVTSSEPMKALQGVPVLMRASVGDAESAEAVQVLADLAASGGTELDSSTSDGSQHGTQMLEQQSNVDEIVAWVTAHLG